MKFFVIQVFLYYHILTIDFFFVQFCWIVYQIIFRARSFLLYFNFFIYYFYRAKHCLNDFLHNNMNFLTLSYDNICKDI